jgi:iron(III) transport system substrate-binding protein
MKNFLLILLFVLLLSQNVFAADETQKDSILNIYSSRNEEGISKGNKKPGWFFADARAAATDNQVNDKQILNIYSSRKEEFLTDLLKVFSEQNNVKINTINDHDSQKLLEKLKSAKSSGISNPKIDADILITADVVSMINAQNNNLLQKSNCDLYKGIKPFFLNNESISNECFWSAISFRARVIAYSKTRVADKAELNDLQDYLDLARFDNKTKQYRWLERIIFTPISSPYNQFLIAYLITLHNDDIVDKWLYKLMEYTKYSNPQGSDTEKLKSIMSGKGDVAMVNSYYYFRMLLPNGVKDESFDSKVGIIFPNQDLRGIAVDSKDQRIRNEYRLNGDVERHLEKGTSINFSAIGVVKDAPHSEMAEKFIQFLLSSQAQEMIAKSNYEYSVTLHDLNNKLNSNVQSEEVKFDMETKLTDVAKNIQTAIKLAEKNGWN